MKGSSIQLVCSADRAYVPHVATMLHSLLVHQESGTHIHLVHGPDLPQPECDLLTDMVERKGGSISFVSVADRQVADVDAAAAASWHRVLLPELLPDQDRVLSLDADLLVLDSLDELWATDLGDDYLAAVTNVFQLDHLERAELRPIDPGTYFNGGVLLMNLEQMRRDGCVAELVDYAARNRKGAWFEQDALNFVLGGRRRHLHPRWNSMNSLFAFPWAAHVFGVDALEEARRNPAIRHFEGPGPNKPWHYLCERPMRELYFEHRRQTPWPEVELDGVTPRGVVARWARRLRRRAERRAHAVSA